MRFSENASAGIIENNAAFMKSGLIIAKGKMCLLQIK